MTTLLIALGWTWLIAALCIDTMAFLMRPWSWWCGPMTTILSAYLWAPFLLVGYGGRHLHRFWNDE